jgi:hypothetical protein
MTDQPLPEAQDIDLDHLVDDLNEKLRNAGSVSSEQAFGMGCGLGFLPIVLIAVLLLVFRVINIIQASILLVMGLLAVVGVGMLLASYARTNSIRRVHREIVEPEIGSYLTAHNLSRQDFDAAARLRLAGAAPLLAFLTPQEKMKNLLSGVEPADEEV